MENSNVKPWLEGVRGTQILPLINSENQIIRVEAGPGTGKTFGLVRRIQRIMHPEGLGVSGDQVLVVAFNRVIAKDLDKDISKCLKNSPHTGTPVIRTVHALCLQVIGDNIRLLLPHEREAMIYDVLCEYPILKQKYRTHKNTEQALRDHEAKHEDHTTLWQAIERWLKRHKARLISDLPGLLLDQLKVGDAEPRTYAHVIVDEFQDLTPGEQELFARLKASDGSFLALGDPRQSIYKFRGNDLNGLSNLETMLEVSLQDIDDIRMTECQRCPGDVVQAANQLMALDPALPMVPDLSRKANTHVVVWDSPEKEAVGMARAIVANMKVCPLPAKHLVMVARKQFGIMLRNEISRIDPSLRVDLSFSEGLLETWAVREAFLLFCLLVDADAATWRAWLGYQNTDNGSDFKAQDRNAAAYLNVLSANGDTISETLIRAFAEGAILPKGAGARKIIGRAQRYFELKEKFGAYVEDATAFTTRLFDVSQWTTKDAEKYEDAVTDMALVLGEALELLEEVKESPKAPENPIEQLRQVARMLRYEIAVREPFSTDGNIDLQVTTFWSAKGVTADHVYVVGLTEQALPGTMRDDYPGTEAEYDAEQRRLFYVSITRSKNTLVLSRAKGIKRTDAARLGLTVLPGNTAWARLDMSPFLRDIIKYLPAVVSGDNWTGCLPAQSQTTT